MLTIVFGITALCGIGFAVTCALLCEREKDKNDDLLSLNQILTSAAQDLKRENFCLFADNVKMRKELGDKTQEQFDAAVGNLKSEKKYGRGA